MYVLYLDESGLHKEAGYFVLAGFAAPEREIHWLGQDLDALQRIYLPDLTDPAHFHASELRAGKHPWSALSHDQRRELKQRIYDIIRNRRIVLFGCAVEKNWAQARGFDPYERAFEDLVSRFDMFMARQNRTAALEGDAEQRGMLVLAKSAYDKTLPVLARELQSTGTRWGTTLHNVTGGPLFAPASDTRQLQLADFCSNAIYGRYNSGLASDFDRIAMKFDYDSGIMHGLSHWSSDSTCGCPACFSRRARS